MVLLENFYAAINRNDIPAILKMCDPEIVRVEPEGFPNSGTFHGIKEFESTLLGGRQKWDEGGCYPESIAQNGDKAVVFVRVHVRLKDEKKWIEGRTADAFQFRDGKILEFRTYTENQKALAWAGIVQK